MNQLEKLRVQIRDFADQRDWNQFHSPKNLAMALIVEAGELVEQFQWITQTESFDLSADKLHAVEDELADILIYLIRLSDQLNVDLIRATQNKIKTNELKYPAKAVRGSSKKYTEY